MCTSSVRRFVEIELALPLMFVIPFAISAAIRRCFIVVLAAVFWPVVAVGALAGLWGSSVGESLLPGTVLAAITSTGGAFGGLVSGRAFAPRDTE